MSVHIDLALIVGVLLCAIRLGVLFALTPLMGGGAIPARIRVMLVLALSTLMVLGTGAQPVIQPTSVEILMVLAVRELVMGALLAFPLLCIFGAFMFAGRVLDMQIGFSVANLIDPVTRSQSPLLGTALHMMALVVFFAVDGHHVIVRMLAASFKQHGLGAPLSELNVEMIASQFGMVFVWGVMLVAPVIFVLLLLDVAIAFMSRTMPQMNVFIVAIPLKIVVGLLTLALTVSVMGGALQKAFHSVFKYWQYIL